MANAAQNLKVVSTPEISEKSQKFGKQVWAYREKFNICLKDIGEYAALQPHQLHDIEAGRAEISQTKVELILTAYPEIANM